jgi:hypothetical protein
VTTSPLSINRAPVLTLWATIVAERLGYEPETALTLGKAVAGLNAQSKGRRLGIFATGKDQAAKAAKKKLREPGKEEMLTLLGRPVPAIHTPEGLRAAIQGEVIDPESVERYLEQKFGEDLDDVRAAMEALAKAHKPEQLNQRAFELYEAFRPSVPEGQKGWGAKGELDLHRIRALAKKG